MWWSLGGFDVGKRAPCAPPTLTAVDHEQATAAAGTLLASFIFKQQYELHYWPFFVQTLGDAFAKVSKKTAHDGGDAPAVFGEVDVNTGEGQGEIAEQLWNIAGQLYAKYVGGSATAATRAGSRQSARIRAGSVQGRCCCCDLLFMGHAACTARGVLSVCTASTGF